MSWVPIPIPNNVEVDWRRRKHRTHVVLKVHKIRKALIVFGLVELSALAPWKSQSSTEKNAGKQEEEVALQVLHHLVFSMLLGESITWFYREENQWR